MFCAQQLVTVIFCLSTQERALLLVGAVQDTPETEPVVDPPLEIVVLFNDNERVPPTLGLTSPWSSNVTFVVFPEVVERCTQDGLLSIDQL